MNRNSNKTIAITGAGKGLGAAYAKYFGGLGLNVLVNNRKHENQENSADLIVDKIKEGGGRAIANYSNIEDCDSGDQILEQCLDEFGSLDYLINNAGVTEGKTFNKVSIKDFNRILKINLNGAINVTHSCFQYMYENNKGSIIFTTSGAGLYGQHGMPAYSTAKAGVIGLAQSLHLESSKKNLNINVISPFANTNMTKDLMNDSQAKKFSVDMVVPLVSFLLHTQDVSGNIFIAGAGKFKVAKMFENEGINLSNHQNISEKDISNEIKDLLDLTSLTPRNNASESFDAL